MNVTAVSIAWAFLQISLLCALSLGVAWSLRGRRPQLVTATLTGTCVASLILALVSVIPQCQWSLAIGDTAQSSTVPIVLNRSQTTFAELPIPAADNHIGSPLSKDHVDTNDSIASVGPSGLDGLRSMISRYIQRMDREVRDAEVWQQPVAKARNVSLLLFLSTGLVVMSLLWCSSWFYMKRILGCSRAIEDRNILDLIAMQAVAFGLKRMPAVRESYLVPIGATVGWHRVTVLLHADWREWSNEERRAVISHELAHAVRHDFAWVIISSWTRILLFFHPMVHALIHRLRLEQELAADQLAAGKVGSAKAYGRALASLALRSQQSLGTSNAKFGSMLNAGQICVTRRVIMLRQGSLKPIQSRSQWSIWAVFAIACTAIPLAGLRGTTQEPVAESNIVKDSPKESDSTQEEKPKPLSKEFLAAYPPLEFKGSMVYRPGRFRAGEFGPEVAWFNDWLSIYVVAKPFPDRATLYGECTNQVSWTDEERLHGRSSMGMSFREAEATLPGQLTQFHRMPFEFANRRFRVVSTQQAEGRTILGVTNSTKTDEPEQWLIDDEQGYFIGSLEEAKQYARGQRFALDSIPENFRTDYQQAAFGIVFNDCNAWSSKIDAFFDGAPQREGSALFGLEATKSIVNELTQVGVFVDGCKTPACSVRAVTKDEHSAKSLAAQVATLVEFGKIALASMPAGADDRELQAGRSILETLQIAVNGSEVVLQFDVFVPSLSEETNKLFSKMVAWIHLNAEVACETPGAIEVRPTNGVYCVPSLVGQTIEATDYRGKTISLELEIQCDEKDANRVGAFVWASSKEPASSPEEPARKPRQRGSQFTGHRVLQAKTLAANATALFNESLAMELSPLSSTLSGEASYRTLSISMLVPADAEHISFGCYTKNSLVRVRNVRFQATQAGHNDNGRREVVQDATADIPYSVLVVPGYTIRKTPTNLNFEQSVSEPVRQAARPSNEALR